MTIPRRIRPNNAAFLNTQGMGGFARFLAIRNGVSAKLLKRRRLFGYEFRFGGKRILPSTGAYIK